MQFRRDRTSNISRQTDSNENTKVVEDDNDYKGTDLYTKNLRAFSDSGDNSQLSNNFVCFRNLHNNSVLTK